MDQLDCNQTCYSKWIEILCIILDSVDYLFVLGEIGYGSNQTWFEGHYDGIYEIDKSDLPWSPWSKKKKFSKKAFLLVIPSLGERRDRAIILYLMQNSYSKLGEVKVVVKFELVEFFINYI